jgi:hypothetical protein
MKSVGKEEGFEIKGGDWKTEDWRGGGGRYGCVDMEIGRIRSEKVDRGNGERERPFVPCLVGWA